MDFNALVEEITKRVYAKLLELESKSIETTPVCKKELSKKVITEIDVKQAFREGCTTIVISQKSILTALARDFLDENKIILERK